MKAMSHLMAILVVLAGAGEALAQAAPVRVEKVSADPVIVYESADGPKVGAIARADFPANVTLLTSSDTGRHQLGLPDGRVVWVLSRHVTLSGLDQRKLSCDTALAAPAVQGVRAGMEGCRK